MKLSGYILCALLFPAGSGCTGEHTQTEHPVSPESRPQICAHRGASGYAPENSLAALKLAMEMGADMAELDIQQTADDRLVVMHDDAVDRTSNGTGLVWQMSSDSLRALDNGSWFDKRFSGERIPTIEEVMSLVRGKMKLNIEVKLHGHERDIARLVVDTIRKEKFENECIVTSFGHEVADEIKRLAPELKVGYIFDRKSYSEAVFASDIDVLSSHFWLVDSHFMAKARAAGKEVHVWTVNQKFLMRRMRKLGVDAIITNYPDRLAEVLAKK
ncbi:MAG TPA: glycerophosphodiester phosphodiesterase [Bacteroidetes bacterium]|nr:glycerophosphodiester phosphodiesterase [Bacteroidota bacterium]